MKKLILKVDMEKKMSRRLHDGEGRRGKSVMYKVKVRDHVVEAWRW